MSVSSTPQIEGMPARSKSVLVEFMFALLASLFPLLLRPKVLALKNHARGNYNLRTQFGRDIVLAIFSVGIVYAIFKGTTSALLAIRANSALAYLHPSLPLNMLLLMLLLMLFLSNMVAAVGSFYNSRDLELLLASPIKPFTFFWGRFCDVLLSSSWMAAIFAVPALMAFGQVYHAGFAYYAILPAALIPYFVIPSSLSIIAVTIMARVIPIARTREIVLMILLLCVALVYMTLRMLAPTAATFNDINELLKVFAIISLPQMSWIPSHWAGVATAELLESSGKNVWTYLAPLFGFALTCVSVAHLTVRFFHAEAFTKSRNNRVSVCVNSKRSQERVLSIMHPINSVYRALLVKEIRMFTRDIAQAIQFLLLLGLCLIYLYNFRMLHAIEGLPSATRAYWQGFLIFANVGLGAFIVTAICSRFVFPSMSLEGQSFWILQSAPIKLHDVLRAKFWCWLFPICFISSVIFGSGALAIDAPWQIVLVNAMTSWILCYGAVGLAVGLGAVFSNFDWEHSSQLAASFGSLLFMLASSITIGISLIPVAVLIFLRTLKNYGYSISATNWYLCVGSSALLLVYVNYAATRWALKAGENAILERSK